MRILISCGIVVLVLCTSAWALDHPLRIQGGAVAGAPSEHDVGVMAYKGIPYAAPTADPRNDDPMPTSGRL